MFQIGSITKVFTGILLAQVVINGEVKLDDPISMYLPQRPGDMLAYVGLDWYLPTLQPEWELHGSARAGC